MSTIKINTRPIKTLKLEFDDGIIREVKFSNYAIMLLDEEFEEGSMKILANAFFKPFLNGAKLLYAGMKACDENVTYDEAKKIASEMDVDAITTIIEIASQSVIRDTDKKKLKNMQVDKKQLQMILSLLKN